jgi:chromosome segregation ATPase
MPQMRDIFKDGLEYFQRSFRWMLLKARLSEERQKLERSLRQLGRRAWDIGAPTCGSVPSGQELRSIQDTIDGLQNRLHSAEEKLGTSIKEMESSALKEGEHLRDIRSRLDGALRQKTRRVKSISEIEEEMQMLSEKSERLKDDQEFCRKRRQEFQSAAVETVNPGDSPADLATTEESIATQLEEIADELKALESRLRFNKLAMPPLESSIAEIRKESDECDARRSQNARQLTELRNELRDLRAAADRELAPLLKQRSDRYSALGRELLHNRSDEPELQLLFSSADLAASAIESLAKESDTEKKLIGLLDQNAIAAFLGIVFGSGMLVLALIALLITLALVL